MRILFDIIIQKIPRSQFYFLFVHTVVYWDGFFKAQYFGKLRRKISSCITGIPSARLEKGDTYSRALCESRAVSLDGESELLTLYKGFHGELNMVVNLEGSIFRNTNISHVRLIKRSHFLCVLCHFWWSLRFWAFFVNTARLPRTFPPWTRTTSAWRFRFCPRNNLFFDLLHETWA